MKDVHMGVESNGVRGMSKKRTVWKENLPYKDN